MMTRLVIQLEAQSMKEAIERAEKEMGKCGAILTIKEPDYSGAIGRYLAYHSIKDAQIYLGQMSK